MKTARDFVTPAVIAAAWGAWRVRHKGSLGPGPGFVEALEAGFAALAAEGLSIVETGRDPATIEACAAIAEGTFKSEHDFGRAGSVIAHAIRSLATSPAREGGDDGR